MSETQLDWNELPLIDESKLLSWQKIYPEDWESIVLEILELFFTTSLDQHQKLLAAYKNLDENSLKSTAHSFKSSCGNVGAVRAHHILNQIEKYGSIKENKSLEATLQIASATYKSSVEALIQFKVRCKKAA
jgi:HPt (histidine-containing phosphotransfer) domain-containing protein